jgi:hypothetical protein
VIKKEAEKILKYKSLVIGMQCMWNLRAKVIPIIIEAKRAVSKSLRHYLSNVQEGTKLRNCQRQPYLALHTYFGKC